MKRKWKASFTIEAALIVPLFLSVFVISLYSMFYYHDKNLIGAAAYETVACGSGRKVAEQEELEAYFQRQVGERTLLFSNVVGEVTVNENEVEITCFAEKNGMYVSLHRKMCRTEPEKKIRSLRKIEKLAKELGETE